MSFKADNFLTHFQLSPFKIKLPSLLIPIDNIINFDFQMFRYKIKLSDARKAWMKNPEVLPNCSTGFHLPPEHDDLSQVGISDLMCLYTRNRLSLGVLICFSFCCFAGIRFTTQVAALLSY